MGETRIAPIEDSPIEQNVRRLQIVVLDRRRNLVAQLIGDRAEPVDEMLSMIDGSALHVLYQTLDR